ncbi:hypothetical protein THRCLA_23087 [Thraustotheca clavata]|uniref:Uncharacterized protein n=1 Tax=Thraustotheca clavata TaxID=74557 RepID=A0A1V9YF54_9STRA|nr:hypothetical protein THRCLA_23087 [Thraustotheca clavata]
MSLLGEEYSDSSSSEDESPQVVISKPAIALPSIDDVFETTIKPKFLEKPTTATVEAFDIEEQVEIATDENDGEDEKAAALAEDETQLRIINSIEVFPGLTETMDEKAQTYTKKYLAKRKAETKNTGKERVKAQRLKGQSGIGNDFRTWKSETEMQLRQQYD